MKPAAALCINGFQLGTDFYPKEIAICDVFNTYSSIIFVKFPFQPTPQQNEVFDWQKKHIHSLGWSFPEGTVPLNELAIAIRQIQQYFSIFVESPFLQKYLVDNFSIQTAVIPQAAIPVRQTSPTFCGIAQHNFGFVCALRRATNNAIILRDWIKA